MKKILAVATIVATLSGCTSLTHIEQRELQVLKGQGVTVDRPVGTWEKPANAGGAALLNLLPGFGNFYLAMGNAGDGDHYLYGAVNLLLWPFSILWGVPEAAVDAETINERDMLYYYKFDPMGKKEVKKAGVSLSID
jgi:hypothetical protein